MKVRLSPTQRTVLWKIGLAGEYRIGVSDKSESRTLEALKRRGLVAEAYQFPLPGNDYGGFLRYTLTAKGRKVVHG